MPVAPEDMCLVEQEEGAPAPAKALEEANVTGGAQVEGREAHTVPLPPSEEGEPDGPEGVSKEEALDEDCEMAEAEEACDPIVDVHTVEKEIHQASDAVPKEKAEELRTIKEMLNAKMTVDQTWYVISRDWLLRWKEFVGWSYLSTNARRPGPIDNSSLVEEATWKLKLRLFAEHDYTQVPEDAWRQLIAWYGGGPAIPRPVIQMGAAKSTKMETYPLGVSLVHNAKIDKPFQVSVSRRVTVAQLKAHGCKLMGVKPSKIRLFSFHVEIKGAELKDYAKTLEEARVSDRSKILFEEEGVETPKGLSGRSNTYSSYSSSSAYSSSYGGYKSLSSGRPSTATTGTSSLYGDRSGSSSSSTFSGSGYSGSSSDYSRPGFGASGYSSASSGSSLYGNSRSSMTPYGYSSSFASSYGYSKPEAKGLTGLTNVGNTCFMNSALQCLSNTVILRDFFLNGEYAADLNRSNPIGMGGKIADEYAALVKSLWDGEKSSVAPSRFKSTIGQFAPQFSGFAQQDSQELLAFLLDGLHEDLNRVREKPQTSTVESDGRGDEVVAKEAWEVYLKRNQSIVVDHFVGQFKSKLVCPCCDKVSITFDPFMYLSLPLPEPTTTVVRITLVRWDSERPVEYALVVPSKATIAVLRKKLGETAGVDTTRLPIAYVAQHEIYRIFRDSDLVTEIRPTYLILALELPEGAKESEEEKEKRLKKEERKRKKEEKQRRKDEKQRRRKLVKRKESEEANEETEQTLRLSSEPETEDCDETAAEQLIPVTVKCVLSTGFYRTPREVGYPFLLPVTSSKTTLRQLVLYIWDRVAPLFPEEDDEDEEEEAVVARAKELFVVRLVSGEGFHAVSKVLDDLDEPILLPKNAHGLSVTLHSGKVVQNVGEVAMRKVDDASVAECGSRVETAKKKVALDACLDAFVQEEVLSPTDPWYCPGCKEMRQAAKTMTLHSLPAVLIIHLKRFKYTRHHRDKLQTLVEFPLRGLDVTSFVPSGQDAIYDLYAVSNHFGALGGGHYTAFAKNTTTGDWYDFDDSRVRKISEDGIVTTSAYLLFYARRGSAAAAEPASS